MKIKNFKKLGISMVALVITIIVLIVLTSAIVINGIGAQKQAQLAVFYSNIDTVQDLVSLKMGENMIEVAMSGLDNNYKWTGIVENPATAFTSTVDGIEENMAPIMVSLLDNTTLADGEKSKYYVGESGKVYYQGFEYEGKIYYNKDKIIDTNPQQGTTEVVGISAEEVAANPMLYYGAYVNYTDANGQPYKEEDTTTDIKWRIFHAEGGYIYLTSSREVEHKTFGVMGFYGDMNADNKVQALEYLNGNSMYLNSNYADSAVNGMTFSTLASSYNKVKRTNQAIKLDGDEVLGFTFVDAVSDEYTEEENYYHMKRLNGTLQGELYDYDGAWYWLASSSADYPDKVMFVIDDDGYCVVNDHRHGWYTDNPYGIRPLVKLKSNVRLVESSVLDANGYMTYNISVPGVPVIQEEPQEPVVQLPLIVTREDIVASPIEYYGAKVNYTAGGQSEWRIFYADEENIYITTTIPIGGKSFTSREAAMKYLNCEPDGAITNASEYINSYADISKTKNGIDFTIFAASYNNVKGANIATLALEGNETTGFYTYGVLNDANATSGYNRHVSRLSGTQAYLYNYGSGSYWLASPSADDSDRVLCVNSYDGYVDREYCGSDYSRARGVRPLVCLKSNIQLEKHGNAYDIIATQ